MVGDNAGVPSLDLVARSSGEAYGQAVTAGDIYKLAAPGAQSAPVVSLPETVGEADGPARLAAVDGAGDIFVGEKSYGVVALDEQASALGEFGQSIPAGGAAFVVGQVTTTFDYPDLATRPSPPPPAPCRAPRSPSTAGATWCSWPRPTPPTTTTWTPCGCCPRPARPASAATGWGRWPPGTCTWSPAPRRAPPESTAGVPALSASFQSPDALAVDAAGNILVGDNGQSYAVSVVAESAAAAYGIRPGPQATSTPSRRLGRHLDHPLGQRQRLRGAPCRLGRLRRLGRAVRGRLQHHRRQLRRLAVRADRGACPQPGGSHRQRRQPATGPVAGGTQVTVTGTGFTARPA